MSINGKVVLHMNSRSLIHYKYSSYLIHEGDRKANLIVNVKNAENPAKKYLNTVLNKEPGRKEDGRPDGGPNMKTRFPRSSSRVKKRSRMSPNRLEQVMDDHNLGDHPQLGSSCLDQNEHENAVFDIHLNTIYLNDYDRDMAIERRVQHNSRTLDQLYEDYRPEERRIVACRRSGN
ncbi:phosphoheptose isomerase [Striga asiatica]|uniref:Phosphoheptose isomerase n=1 Tax=Striga asiatica TaxID=4170 RepID=A0A5A7PC24_STRAF|nr:phosphoheptose isomerase [Striga asiatica]